MANTYVGSAPNTINAPKAGKRQGVLLLIGSCLPILGAVLLGPVLPAIRAHFFATPHVDVLTPLLMTTPALALAITAPFMGWVIDRFGRRRPLIVALIAYSIVGLAPFWLASMHAILISRLLLGVTEALVMTACTTLIGDYFHGKSRETWFSAQAGAASLAATLFFGVGGLLGTFGWRAPFILYAAGIVLLPLVLLWVREPRIESEIARETVEPETEVVASTLALAYPLALVTGIGLLLLPIHFGFLLENLNVHAPQIIGLLSAANQGAVLIGAMIFPLISRIAFRWIFAAGMLLNGVGVIASGASPTVTTLLLSGVCAGLGSGLLLTSLINWTFESLSAAARGRGAGGFNASIFLGEFLCPLVVIALTHTGASLNVALQYAGLVMLIVGALTFFISPRTARR